MSVNSDTSAKSVGKKASKAVKVLSEEDNSILKINNPVIQQVLLSDLKPYYNNPRVNKDTVKYVESSINNFGFLVPIVVDTDSVIISGHTRYLAAMRLGLVEVPVIVATHLTDVQAKAFRLADNKVAEYSTWDDDMLARELEELKEMGFVLEMTGFDKEELDCILTPVNADCLDDLTVENVCGDVKDATFAVKNLINISIGMYKFRITVGEYHKWEKKMMKQYGGSSEITKELADRLGLSPYIHNSNE
jgi:hypothetical protein